MTAHAARALDGIVVLELGQVYNAPYCGLLLGYLGATVIKIEPPRGEPARHRAGGQQSAAFSLVNAGKRGVCLDLKSAAGQQLFLRLVEGSDVLVENYRRGVLDRLGLGYEKLSQVNPRLVVASGRGFASSGPYRDLAAMDLTVQAMTGLLAATGFLQPDQPPVKAGGAVADFLGGAHLLAGILAALLQRERTGRGQCVEVAMQDALLPSLASNLGSLFQSGGRTPERTGNRHGGLAICPYNVYRARDGWIALLCAADRHWQVLCTDVLERPDLAAEPSLRTNVGRVARMDEIDAIVEAWTAQRSRAECAAAFEQARLPHAPVLGLAEVVADPQVQASGMLRRVRHPSLGQLPAFGSPLRLSGSPASDLGAAPSLGEHTREVLRERLSLSEAEIDTLFQDGVVA